MAIEFVDLPMKHGDFPCCFCMFTRPGKCWDPIGLGLNTDPVKHVFFESYRRLQAEDLRNLIMGLMLSRDLLHFSRLVPGAFHMIGDFALLQEGAELIPKLVTSIQMLSLTVTNKLTVYPEDLWNGLCITESWEAYWEYIDIHLLTGINHECCKSKSKPSPKLPNMGPRGIWLVIDASKKSRLHPKGVIYIYIQDVFFLAGCWLLISMLFFLSYDYGVSDDLYPPVIKHANGNSTIQFDEFLLKPVFTGDFMITAGYVHILTIFVTGCFIPPLRSLTWDPSRWQREELGCQTSSVRFMLSFRCRESPWITRPPHYPIQYETLSNSWRCKSQTSLNHGGHMWPWGSIDDVY